MPPTPAGLSVETIIVALLMNEHAVLIPSTRKANKMETGEVKVWALESRHNQQRVSYLELVFGAVRCVEISGQICRG